MFILLLPPTTGSPMRTAKSAEDLEYDYVAFDISICLWHTTFSLDPDYFTYFDPCLSKCWICDPNVTQPHIASSLLVPLTIKRSQTTFNSCQRAGKQTANVNTLNGDNTRGRQWSMVGGR